MRAVGDQLVEISVRRGALAVHVTVRDLVELLW